MNILGISTFLAALGSGVMGGFFFAFSNLVMPSLGRVPAPAAILAMQTINLVVQNPIFFAFFFGTALVSIVLLISAFFTPGGALMTWLLLGSVIYLGGIIVVTMIANVPMNNALAVVDPAATSGAALWADYLVRWSWWNHVRTITGILASACFMMAFRAA